MTKFNQQRRLEDRHIAEKHHIIKSPRKGAPARIAVARASHASSTSHSPSSHSRRSPGFDVIGSSIPRQQRTHAIYRRDSDPSSSAGPSPNRQQALKSPSPNRHSTAGQPAKAQRSLGSDNGICKQGSLDSAKQQVQQLFKPKPQRSPSAQSQARASAELMLQANAVLQELDQSLLQVAEAASAEVAAATAAPASQRDSTAVPKRPVSSSSPRVSSPQLPVVPRVMSSAIPRLRVQAQKQECDGLGPGSSTSLGLSPPPQPLQHRSFSMPAQQPPNASSSVDTLSHSQAQLRQARLVDRAHMDNNTDQQAQQQQPQQLTTQSPPLLSKAEPGSVTDAHEFGQEPCHAETSKGLPSPERSDTGTSHMSQDRPGQGLSGNQSHPADLAVAALEEPGSKAASAQADTDSTQVDHRSGSLSKESVQGIALPSVLHPSDHNAKAAHAGTAPHPAASDTAALAKALSEASGRSPRKATSNPPGALPHNALSCPALPALPCWPCLAGKLPCLHSSLNPKHQSLHELSVALPLKKTKHCALPFAFYIYAAAICVQITCKSLRLMYYQILPPLRPPPRLSWIPRQALSQQNPS